MLRIDDIHAAYGKLQVLFGVSLDVQPGEIHCLLGRNGAGKSTVLKTVMGLVAPTQGRILLDGTDLSALPGHAVAAAGVGYVPQGRRLFPELSVAENIEIGLMAGGTGAEARDWVLEMFPRLRERLRQQANTLSGGEQQMLATARALCLRPRVLLLDEPTEGLQPSMIELIRDVILRLRAEGLAVLLVEQRIEAILELSDRATFIENGRTAETLTGDALRADPAPLHRYLGV